MSARVKILIVSIAQWGVVESLASATKRIMNIIPEDIVTEDAIAAAKPLTSDHSDCENVGVPGDLRVSVSDQLPPTDDTTISSSTETALLIREPALPGSNREAINTYLSAEFSNFDLYGYPRWVPSLSRYLAQTELLPGWLFRADTAAVEVHLDSLIGQSRYSTVWSIKEQPSYAIKYHGACPSEYKNQDGVSVDSTLVEAYFLTLLSNSGLTNELIYFSGALEVPLVEKPGKKVKFVFCKSSSNKLIPPVVRYFITTRVGLSIGQLMTGGVDTLPFYWDQKIPFVQSILFGMQLFEMIKELHEKYSIIHGDLHLENVTLEWRSDEEVDETSDLKFIDWGRAVVFNASEVESIIGPTDYSFDPETDDSKSILCHGISTYWESIRKNNKLIPTFRDDAMRVLLMIATMIHGYDLSNAMAGMCSYGNNFQDPGLVAEYLRFKNEVNFFDCEVKVHLSPKITRTYSFSLSSVVTDYEDIPIVDEAVIETVRSKFMQMLAHVRSLTVTEKPDYDRLIGYLKDIDKLLETEY